MGLGELVFDWLEVDFVKVMLLLLVMKGFEIGSGFVGMLLKGLEYNDLFEVCEGKMCMVMNCLGGI